LPRATAASADGTTVLVINDGDKTLSVIDTAANKVVEVMKLGEMLGAFLKDGQPLGHAVASPDGATIYVTGAYFGVAAIDRRSRTVKAIGFTDGQLVGGHGVVAISTDGSTLFAPRIGAGLLTIDAKTMTVRGLLPRLGPPFVVSRDGRFAASVDPVGSQIVVVALADFVARAVPFGQAMRSTSGTTSLDLNGIDISPDGKRLYVTRWARANDRNWYHVFGIDLASGAVTSSPPVSTEKLSGISLTRDGERLVVPVPSLGLVKVFSAATLKELGSFAVGPTPMAYRDFAVGTGVRQ
jgi:YVTN family beta-propeller protein